MSAPSPTWYLRRLRQMSPQEVLSRTQDSVRRQAWANRQVHPGEIAPLPPDLATVRHFGAVLPKELRSEVSAEVVAEVVAAADSVLNGTWHVLGQVRVDSAAPDWFYDPLTGKRAPQDTYAFKVHHRDENETGNIKQLWEMSRHHHLTVLAAAYWLTGQEHYAQNVADQLRSWWSANPFLSGVHWTSGIEVGIRLISWTWIRRLLADWPGIADLFERNDDALRQIAWHQEFLAAFPSRGSSANNHVIAEAAGQLSAACAFDWYGRSLTWRADAAQLLERELALNTFASGLNRELATEYHRFVLDLVMLAAIEADRVGHQLSDGTWHRLALMSDAAMAMLDVAGNAPRQGDGDNGQALVVDNHSVNEWARTLGGATAVMGAAPWYQPVEASLQAVVVGGLAMPRPQTHAAVQPRAFRDAGMVILSSNPSDGAQIWARFDGGPHGFLSIAAHGHADALSMELRQNGVEILIDPGTYCYHGEPQWRSWFRSTKAHNTIELADTDQSTSGGPFMWSRHAESRLTDVQVGPELPVQTVAGEHDGYRALSSPILHQRRVELDSPGRTVTVRDQLISESSNSPGSATPVRMSWHLGPEVTVSLEGTVARLTWVDQGEGKQALIELDQRLQWQVSRGAEAPVDGWYSPGFGEKVATTSLIGRLANLPATELVTRFHLNGE